MTLKPRQAPADPSRSRPDRPGRPGRPRDPEAERAILAATLELIAEGGFRAVRMADVADRAGVSKTTMYRRWPGKADLVVAALHQSPSPQPVDTGSLRSDLVNLLSQLLGATRSTPFVGLLAELAAERQREPRLAQVLDPLLMERARSIGLALQRGVARGEVDPEVDLELAVAMLGGPILLRLFFGGSTEADVVDRAVDLLIRAVAPNRTAPS